jgi:hypothetical protein
MDRIDSIMGRWNRNREMEVYLTTYDGAQHLRLHGWLKRNDTLIKMESFADKGEELFGSFIVYITEKTLDRLKKENLEKGLFTNIDILSNEEARWKGYKGMDNITKLDEGIKSFLFDVAGQLSSPEDISKFVGQANETTIKLFKESDSYITEYVETNDMSYDNKMKDLNMLIEYVEERERYEDCALLVKIKEKIIKHYKKQKIKKDE